MSTKPAADPPTRAAVAVESTKSVNTNVAVTGEDTRSPDCAIPACLPYPGPILADHRPSPPSWHSATPQLGRDEHHDTQACETCLAVGPLSGGARRPTIDELAFSPRDKGLGHIPRSRVGGPIRTVSYRTLAARGGSCRRGDCPLHPWVLSHRWAVSSSWRNSFGCGAGTVPTSYDSLRPDGPKASVPFSLDG